MIRQLAARDLKARYKVSVLGFFWSLLRPLLTIGVLALVFSFLLNFESTRYQVTYTTLLLVTYLPWFFFSSALLEATSSLLTNANLVKKVYCPRAVFPVAVVVSNLVNFLFSLAVLIPVVYVGTGASPTWTLMQLPFLLLTHTALLLGLALLVSATNVLYRDTTQIMEFGVFIWFYLSPVLYDVYDIFPMLSKYTTLGPYLYLLNPMAGLLEWYRYIVLSSQLVSASVLEPGIQAQVQALNQTMFQMGIPYAAGVSYLILAAGYSVFKRLEVRAVDEL